MSLRYIERLRWFFNFLRSIGHHLCHFLINFRQFLDSTKLVLIHNRKVSVLAGLDLAINPLDFETIGVNLRLVVFKLSYHFS